MKICWGSDQPPKLHDIFTVYSLKRCSLKYKISTLGFIELASSAFVMPVWTLEAYFCKGKVWKFLQILLVARTFWNCEHLSPDVSSTNRHNCRLRRSLICALWIGERSRTRLRWFLKLTKVQKFLKIARVMQFCWNLGNVETEALVIQIQNVNCLSSLVRKLYIFEAPRNRLRLISRRVKFHQFSNLH